MQDKIGRGLLVEHHGSSEKVVKDMIFKSLNHMRLCRSFDYGDIGYKIEKINYNSKPACALVAAVYKSEGWDK